MDLTAPGILAALAAAFGWALYDLARRFLSSRMSAWTLVVWTTLPALPLIAAWGFAARDWRIESGYLVPGLASALLNVAANFLYFRAFQLSPLSVTLPMLSLTPVFASVLGLVALGEPISARTMGGIACVVFGAFRLTVGSDDRRLAARVERGSVLMALVALCWSATLLLDKLALRHSSPPTHALVLYAGVALGGLVALAARGSFRELGELRGNVAIMAAAIGVGIGALAAQLFAIRLAEIGLVETLKRGVGGVLAVVWGRAFFREAVTGAKLLALAFLIVGVALILL